MLVKIQNQGTMIGRNVFNDALLKKGITISGWNFNSNYFNYGSDRKLIAFEDILNHLERKILL